MWIWLLPALKKLEPVLAWIVILYMTFIVLVKPHFWPTPTQQQKGGANSTFDNKKYYPCGLFVKIDGEKETK